MTPPKLSLPRAIAKSVVCATMLLCIVSHGAPVRADSTDGSTPLALKPGAPAGSYALSEFDNINPYNGSLNFRLPLLNIGGRGTAGYTMTLPIEQKWRINVTAIHLLVYSDGGNGPLPEPQVNYHYFPTANWWSGIKPGYGPGVMHGRVAQLDAQVCPDSTLRAGMTLTRLTFTAPDGTEFELHDTKSNGTPAAVGLCDPTGFNREKVFVTSDGSAATFISDENIVDNILVSSDVFYPTGYLLLRDGTRYRFDNGTVTWLRDRNGNKISFTYDSFKRATVIKDSLNREVTITYATSSILFDEITYKGFGGATRAIRVNYGYLQDPGSLRGGYSVQAYNQLFPISGASANTNYNPKVIRSVTLPNNQQYQFQYNSYGELARVVLPTGGAFEYDHASGVAGNASGITGGFDEYSMNVYRRVTTKRVYADGTTLESRMTFSNTEGVPCSGCVVIDHFGSDGVTRISQRRIFYEGNPILSFFQGPTDYSPWNDGKELQSESVAENGTTVLQKVVRTWQQPLAGASWPLTQAETNAAAKANNPQVTEVNTTLEPSQANKVAKQTFAYDKYTNQTDVYEYDFGSGTAGALVRRSHTDFLTSSYDTLNPSATNPDVSQTSHIRSLPAQVSIFDAGGAERARTTTEYDNYALDGADCLHSFHCPLVARANISGFDSLFGAGYTKRGNPTASTRYLLSNGVVTGSVSSYSQYDLAGNVVRVLDPRSTLANNIATTIEYDDRYGAPNNEARSNTVPPELSGFTSFAFPTKVINALGHTSYAKFDYYLGKPVNGEDANGVIASGSFNDSLDRPRQIRRAIGTSAENQTTFDYDDANRIVTTSSDKDAVDDNLLVSKVEYDQMGRTTATRQYEGGANYIVAKTEYDALGRPYKNSSPFRPWQSETAVWTTQQFDALGRVITVTTPDNAVVSTSYSGNTVTVTDQAGKARKSVTDALGRLTDIYEDPAGLNYQTSYMYDVLDSLVKVTQGDQHRFFMYDSLKRLIRADNPEQETLSSLNLTDPVTNHSNWSFKYEYDNNGNLTSKSDARGIVTHNIYDVLNRLTTVLYRINGQPDPNTGDIEYLYDNAPYGKGRLWLTYRWGAKPSHTAVGQYDAMGRVKQLNNLFGDGQGGWSAGYEVYRNYNLAGDVTSQTYPSGHTVNYSYDAAGRTGSFTGNLGDGVTRSYASTFVYNARSQVTQELLGTQTPLYHKLQYNIRGQLWDVRVSTGSDVNGSANRGGLQYFYDGSLGYGTSGPDNNGNVLFANTYTPADEQGVQWAIHRQSYNYDSLNRLKSVTEYFVSYAQPESQQSLQTYDYDRWGNRTINTAQTWGAEINNTAFEIETSRNRLYSPGDLALQQEDQRRIRYDKAGNQIKDTYTGYGTATFDGDNRIVAIQDKFGGSASYTYNANAQRVRRRINNQETWQIYGIDGELVAEYAANSAVSAPQKEYGYRNGELLITAESGSSGVSGSPYGGTAAAIPGVIQTENYDNGGEGVAYHDTTSGTHGQDYDQPPNFPPPGFRQPTDVDIYKSSGYSNGYLVVGQAGDWTSYSVNVSTSGTYSLQALVAWGGTNGSVGSFHVEVDGVDKTGAWQIPDTGWNFTTLTKTGVQLTAGTHLLRIVWDVNASNGTSGDIDYLNFTLTGTASPYGGTAAAIPGVIQTENYDNGGEGVAYHDTTSGTHGQDYDQPPNFPPPSFRQPTDVDIYKSSGYSNGYLVVGQAGDWTTYSVNVSTSGTYSLQALVAWGGTNGSVGSFHVEVDGVDKTGAWQIPDTGWSFTTLTKTGVQLTAGTHLLRIVWDVNASNGTSGDIDYLNFTLTSASNSSSSIHWLVTDQLGTPRIILDQTGAFANVKRHDYLPFGEELSADAGGRTPAMGYVAGDGIRQQFTLKERDNETGLDFFEARYYASVQGRFTSPDPTLLSVNGFNPQTWNRYNYVLNNPLLYIDPLGLWEIYAEDLYKEKKNKDGTVTKVYDRTVVYARKTKDDDDGASLAKQLGLEGKDAAKFAEKIGSGDNVRLAEQGGDVGRVFRAVESGLTEQTKWEARNPGQSGGPRHSDCSRVACSIAFPRATFGVLQVGTRGADALISAEGATKSVAESALRIGDIVRWADARNNPQHFASFIFRDDSGKPIVFSKSGERGPYERATTSDPRWAAYGYGTIRGINSGETGYYRPRN